MIEKSTSLVVYKQSGTLMSPEDIARQNTLVRDLILNSKTEELLVLSDLMSSLLQVRQGDFGTLAKVRMTVASVAKFSVAKQVLVTAAKFVKKHGWDRRQRTSRAGILAVAAAVSVFGGQAAGIAAFGSAIGVPLWIVFGSGAMFAQSLVDGATAEVERRNQAKDISGGIVQGSWTSL